MAFTSTQTVRDVLGLGSAYDARIAAMIPLVEGKLEAATGRFLSSATVTDDVVGGTGILLLPRFPVSAVSSVTDRETSSVIASTGYDINAKSGYLSRRPLGTNWDADPSQGIHRYEVEYTGGWTTVPDDVIAAGIDWIAHDLRGQGGLQSEKEGDYSYTLAFGADGLPQSVSAITAKYRAPV